MAFKDETGNRYGRLTVLHRDESKPKGHGYKVWWICQCDCGNIKSIKGENLRRGLTKSCGCLQKETVSIQRFKDISGQRFGYLVPLYPVGQNNSGNTIWHCRCLNCGGFKDTVNSNLIDGHTKSCGCIGQSYGETKIEEILTQNQINYKKQYTFEDLRSFNGGILRFDFAIFKNNELWCLIEYQGIQHYQKSPQFDNWDNLEKRQLRDKYKRKYCEEKNIRLIEIPYTEENQLSWNYLKEKCNL